MDSKFYKNLLCAPKQMDKSPFMVKKVWTCQHLEVKRSANIRECGIMEGGALDQRLFRQIKLKEKRTIVDTL